jgi:hypothetical protein
MWSGGWAPTGSGPPSGRYRPAGSGELARAKDLDQQALVILERRLVMVEFPSTDHARRWYASEDYVAAIPPSRCDMGAWSYGAAFVLTCGEMKLGSWMDTLAERLPRRRCASGHFCILGLFTLRARQCTAQTHRVAQREGEKQIYMLAPLMNPPARALHAKRDL